MINGSLLAPDEMYVPPLSDKQAGFIIRSTTRVNLLEGSIRSGKTFASLVRWLTFIADDAPKRGALVMVGKSRDSLFRNVFEPIENDPTLAVFQPFIHYKQGAPTANILGRIVHIIGAADAKAESKIRGMTVAGAYIDELTTLPRDFFKQMLGRASVPGASIFATTNPDAPKHWLKSEYLDKISEFPDWRVWHFTMHDNPGLTAEYIASLSREYTGLWYRRFILGEWVAAEGAIFDTFDPQRHVIKRNQLPNIDNVIAVGLDYGTTHATRAYLIGIGTDPITSKAALYVLSEFAPGTATVGQHAQMFRAWLKAQQPQSWQEPQWIAIDPAAAVMRQQLFDDGHSNLMRAHNAVLSGIQTVSSLFAAGRLYVLDDCTELIKGIPGYRWDSAASAKGLTKPIKEDDDECVAIGTPVLTAQGWRPVQDVKTGDLVHTRVGLRPVLMSSVTHGGRAVATLRFELSNGRSLVVTGNHPMFLADGSVRRAGALTKDDVLYGWLNPPTAPVAVRVLHVSAGPTVKTWNLTVANQPEYVAAGVLVHNCDALRYGIYSTRRLWSRDIPITAAARNVDDEIDE